MPVHDWTRVEAGIFHHFHHAWIDQITRALNAGVLPESYYALAEQQAAGYGPDVLTLQAGPPPDEPPRPAEGTGGLLLATPPVRLSAEADRRLLRRKKVVIAVRHVSGDRVVATIEVVSPGNKSSDSALRSFVEKASSLLERGIHLLILDLLPPGPRDPSGIHGAIWEDIDGQSFTPPADKPLTLVSYESAPLIRAYIEPIAVGDVLPDMPLFLVPGGHVLVPLEATYQSAWEAVPRRWRGVLEAG